MSKNLCDLAKKDNLSKNLADYVTLIYKGKYVCEKCGRVAIEKSNLCQGEKIKKILKKNS